MENSLETKKDLEIKAKQLIDNSPCEAISIYQTIYKHHNDVFNNWDAFFVMKAMRNCPTIDLDWCYEIVNKFREEKVCNIYGWLILDKCVKGKTRLELLENEKYIESLIEICPQKNLIENNSFPCPTTISVFKLCDAHSENLFNARKINELLSKINYEFLSNSPQTIDTEKRGSVELASDLEKYFALKTKALIKLNDYSSCKELCKIALNKIAVFHYDNDMWFKMRIGLCEEGLGNTSVSEQIFQELLSSKSGSNKWFLYRDLSQIYFDNDDFEKSWKYAVMATFFDNEPHFFIGLYLLQARILFKLKRTSEAALLSELIASILNEQQWNDRLEYNKLFNYFGTNRNNVRPVQEVIKDLKKFWIKEKYGENAKVEGIIISIHPNGKFGKIKDNKGEIIPFSKKDFTTRIKDLNIYKEAKVKFFLMKNYDNKDVAEQIELADQKTTEQTPIKKKIYNQLLEGEVIKILHNNERGKAGFIKCNEVQHYFSVPTTFNLSTVIDLGTRVTFEVIPGKEDKKDLVKIKNIIL